MALNAPNAPGRCLLSTVRRARSQRAHGRSTPSVLCSLRAREARDRRSRLGSLSPPKSMVSGWGSFGAELLCSDGHWGIPATRAKRKKPRKGGVFYRLATRSDGRISTTDLRVGGSNPSRRATFSPQTKAFSGLATEYTFDPCTCVDSV
jgi:hypothetical protein